MFRGGGYPPGLSNPANVAITGGTIANATVSGTTNAVYTPSGVGAVSAIPFIHLSSGSVSAVGAISAITALPLTYTDAYCWFPANALATAIAAGWYYCTFSGTTAGTAFLNTYTSGQPAIPASPTAVTDGKGAFTSDTAAHNGPTVSIAGNSLGINGQLRLKNVSNYTNSAGTKTLGFSFAGSASTLPTQTTSLNQATEYVVANRGAVNKQVISAYGTSVGGVTNISPVLAALDTTTAQNMIITLNKNTATDNLVLERYSIEVMFSS